MINLELVDIFYIFYLFLELIKKQIILKVEYKIKTTIFCWLGGARKQK